jgi:glycosyltransferase involved in cell wall biosynthesis
MVSIVLPVHNQSDHIEKVVLGYLEALKVLPVAYEMILVANACSDNSNQICARLAREHGDISLITSEEQGWGNAVRMGLAEAHGDLLCYTNSARTAPNDLVSVISYARVHPNVAIKATRKLRANPRRKLGSSLYNFECRSLFCLKVQDINGTPKLFPRQFDRLLSLEENGDLIDLEFCVTCARNHYPVQEIPTYSFQRSGGVSTTNYRSAVKMYIGALLFWFRRHGWK